MANAEDIAQVKQQITTKNKFCFWKY